jgi:hypothetical protein
MMPADELGGHFQSASPDANQRHINAVTAGATHRPGNDSAALDHA